MSTERYYIQRTTSVVGDCMTFWRWHCNGYTTKLEDAGQFRLSEATMLITEKDVLWRVEDMDKIAAKMVDIQDVKHAPAYSDK